MTWRQALEASIVIWRKRAAGKIVNKPCPMCALNGSGNGCRSCIANKRGRCCDGFYSRWIANGTCSSENAKPVLDYLISLRNHPKCRIRKKTKVGIRKKR